MHAWFKIAAVVSLVSTLVAAFSDTYPLVAWSSDELSSVSLLAPTIAHSVFRPSPQTPFPAAAPPTDLCTLSSLLLISLPGFHASDLLLLPSTSAILSSLNAASDRSLTLPYLPLRQNQRASSEGPEKLAKTFVAECGAVIQKEGQANFWGGEAGKTLMVEVVAGLDEWVLVGANARNERASIMQRVDSLVAGHLSTLSVPYLVVLTSLPTSTTSSLALNSHVKRQFEDEGDYEIEYSEDEIIGSAQAPPSNGTSIFAVDPKSGLLHRYVFFTPPLIFGLLITLFILIPVVVISSNALTSIETVAGLEGKMTGTVGLDPSKA